MLVFSNRYERCKTVVIWVSGRVTFFTVDYDISHLNNKFIDSEQTTPEEHEEISNLIVGRTDMTSSFPVHEIKNGAKVVVTGYLP